MKSKNIDQIVEAVATQITENEHEVWVYVGCGYVLDQNGLRENIKKAIENF